MNQHVRHPTVHPGQTFNMAAYTISRAALVTPDKPALLVFGERPNAGPIEMWSFASLERAVLNVAAGLRERDYPRGARIAIRLENTSLYPIVFFGAIAAGYVPVAVSAALTARETALLIDDCEASAVITAPTLPVGDIAACVEVIAGREVSQWLQQQTSSTYAFTLARDPAFMVYTSGTTARPKGVVHAQRSIIGRRPMVDGWYGLTSDDRVLHAGAFNWTYTLGTGLCDPWAIGATAIVTTGRKSPPEWPALIARSGATIFAAVPGVFRQILKYGAPTRDNLGELRHGLIAGEQAHEELFTQWKAETGRELYQALGQSELSTYVSTSPTVPRRVGAIGKAQPGRRIAVLPVEGGDVPLPAGEEGLLAVHHSDPGLMIGYWRRPDEEADLWRGEWFVGGDLAHIDEDGYVWHHGRVDDVMKVLGYRVSPLEVEDVLAQHPDVADVACAAIQVRLDVKVVGAFVVLRAGAKCSAEALSAFAAARLADYKCPRSIIFLNELPRTENGKIKRRALAGFVNPDLTEGTEKTKQ